MTDKRLVKNLAGLNVSAVRQVEYALQMCSGDHNLPAIYTNTLNLLECLVELVSTEINSCRCDLRYWENMTHSTKIEVELLKWHVLAYRYMKHAWHRYLPGLAQRWRCTTGPTVKRLTNFTQKMRNIMRQSVMASTEQAASIREHAAAVANADASSALRTRLSSEEVERQELLHIHDVSGNIDEHIFVLRFDLQQMCCMMASIKEASEHLKRIYTEIAVTSQRTVATRSRRQSNQLAPQLADQLYNFACQNISYCLRDLLNTIRIYDVSECDTQVSRTRSHNYLSSLHDALADLYNKGTVRLLSDEPPVALDPRQHELQSSRDAEDAPTLDDDDEDEDFMFAEQESDSGNPRSAKGVKPDTRRLGSIRQANKRVFRSLRAVYEDVRARLSAFTGVRGGYPLQLTDLSARRPSRAERLWLRDFALTLAGLYSLKKLYGMHQSGYLKELVDRAAVSIAENITQHLIEPLQALSQFLYMKIEKNEEIIVTRRELRDSRRDLKEMLDSTLKQIADNSKGWLDSSPKVEPVEAAGEKSADGAAAAMVKKSAGAKSSAKVVETTTTKKADAKFVEKIAVKSGVKPLVKQSDAAAATQTHAPAVPPVSPVPPAPPVSMITWWDKPATESAPPPSVETAVDSMMPGDAPAQEVGYLGWWAGSAQSVADYIQQKVEYFVPPASDNVNDASDTPGKTGKPALRSGAGLDDLLLDQSLEAPAFNPKLSKEVTVAGANEDATVLAEIAAKRAAGAPPRASMEIDNISDEYLDTAMEHVMRNYKIEAKNPMKNAFSGSLLNVSLIQMQKVKVMTEAAMLRLDQLLATNQLTMAGMAAMPALMLAFVCSIAASKLFTMNPPTTAAKTLQLRLILADVERSLQEVYRPMGESPSGSSRSASANLLPSPSHGTFASEISPRQVRLSLSNHGPFQFSSEAATTRSAGAGVSSPVSSGFPAESESDKAQRLLSSMYPDEEDLFRPVPIVRVNSAGLRTGDTFRYMENARLISRGRLTNALLEMRKELIRAFTPRYKRWLQSLPLFIFESSSDSGERRHTNASWMRLPFRIFKRMFWSEMGTSTGDKEYDAILGDVVKLEAPEDEVSGPDKIIVAARMRQSYLCFSMN